MNDPLPLVTVIMPVRNEGEYIERSLGAVLAQDYPAERVEVIVADGMSTDGTREYVRSVMIDNVRGSPGTARESERALTDLQDPYTGLTPSGRRLSLPCLQVCKCSLAILPPSTEL